MAATGAGVAAGAAGTAAPAAGVAAAVLAAALAACLPSVGALELLGPVETSGAGASTMSWLGAAAAALAALAELAAASAAASVPLGRINSTVIATAPISSTATSKIHGSALEPLFSGSACDVLIDDTEGKACGLGVGAAPCAAPA